MMKLRNTIRRIAGWASRRRALCLTLLCAVAVTAIAAGSTLAVLHSSLGYQVVNTFEKQPTVTLVSGWDFNIILKEAAGGIGYTTSEENTNITSITFGKKSDYASAVSGVTGVAVDVNKTGSCNAYLVSNGSNYDVYVLSENDNMIAFNGDSMAMFLMFRGLTSIDFGNNAIDTSKVDSMEYMLAQCPGLTTLDLSSFNTLNVTTMEAMFYNSENLVTLDLSSFNTSKVRNMSDMFLNCGGLTTLDLSSFNTSNVTTMSSMFHDCNSLTSVDLSSFNTSNVRAMVSMFHGALNLQTIYVSELWNTTSLQSEAYSANMFVDNYLLVGGAGTTYNASRVNATYARIDGGTSSPGYFTDIADKPATTSAQPFSLTPDEPANTVDDTLVTPNEPTVDATPNDTTAGDVTDDTGDTTTDDPTTTDNGTDTGTADPADPATEGGTEPDDTGDTGTADPAGDTGGDTTDEPTTTDDGAQEGGGAE